ncbi:MAG: Asp23/Gls24 family envelope stress response protein [Sporolactobacillus sp.]
MAISMNNQFGQIEVSADVITKIAGGAAVDCEGIVGMASKNQLKDGFDELLKKENFSRGVIVRFDEEKNLFIDMYIIVNYGTQISDVAIHLQNKVKSALHHMLGLRAAEINIYVQGVRMVEEKETSEELVND